jgi:hypothetical protein
MSKRFKLIYLGENEEYLRDVGCSIDVRRLPATKADVDIPQTLDRLLRSGGFKGRLRVGSQSLFLEIEGIVWKIYILHHNV